MNYTVRASCSASVYEILHNLYPDAPIQLINFMFYLSITQFKDADTGDVLLPADLLRKFCWKREQHRNVELFLETVRDQYLPSLRWTDFDHLTHKARTGTFELPKELLAIPELELESLRGNGTRVLIKTGRPFTERHVKAIMSESIAQPSIVLDSPKSQKLIGYLNGQSNKSYMDCWRNVPDAAAKVTGMGDSQVRLYNAFVLGEVNDNPRPKYSLTENACTDRVFARGLSFLSLSSDVRRVLLKGTYECDLKHAQLSIISKLWGLDDLRRRLHDGYDFWTDLMVDIGVDNSKKPAVKQLLYSTIFGMSLRNLRANAKDALGFKAGRQFFRTELIKCLLRARRAQAKHLLEVGEAKLISGRVIEVNEKNILSVMAQMAQAYEIELLEPAFDYAIENKRFQVLAWQHDGFTVKVTDGRAEQTLRSIRKAIEKRAKELDVPTCLEWELYD